MEIWCRTLNKKILENEKKKLEKSGKFVSPKSGKHGMDRVTHVDLSECENSFSQEDVVALTNFLSFIHLSANLLST